MQTITFRRVYRVLHSVGNRHSSFQVLSNLQWDDDLFATLCASAASATYCNRVQILQDCADNEPMSALDAAFPAGILRGYEKGNYSVEVN